MKIEDIIPQIKEDAKSIFISSIKSIDEPEADIIGQEMADKMVNDANLEGILKEWMSGDEDILSYKVSIKSGVIIFITELDKMFYIYRFFPSSNKWAVSVDLQEKTLTDVLNHLLKFR